MVTLKTNFNPVNEFKDTWITNKIDETAINYLQNFGLYLCDKENENQKDLGNRAVTISQIRNIFGEVKRIQANAESNSNKDWHTDFLLLRPRIAYNAARVLSKKGNSRIKEFREVLEKAHRLVDNDINKLKRFSKFLEAIVAYHKVYGGKE